MMNLCLHLPNMICSILRPGPQQVTHQTSRPQQVTHQTPGPQQVTHQLDGRTNLAGHYVCTIR